LASLGNTSSTFLLVLLKDANLLEGLYDLSVNAAASINVLGRTAASVLGSTVDLA
jgi:hypothetical protein